MRRLRRRPLPCRRSPPPLCRPCRLRVAPAPAAAARPPAVATAEPGRATCRAGVDPASAAPAASAPRIYAQAELPEDVRRDLPRIAINGSSYSGDAASRMVMISGQIFHEGDSLGAGHGAREDQPPLGGARLPRLALRSRVLTVRIVMLVVCPNCDDRSTGVPPERLGRRSGVRQVRHRARSTARRSTLDEARFERFVEPQRSAGRRRLLGRVVRPVPDDGAAVRSRPRAR